MKLLRVLENKCIERIGSNKKIGVDLRLISATNRNIDREISEGKFREDLLYRINTITIYVPPLRERKEDIPAFIKFFLNNFKNEMKKNITKIDDGLMDILLSYDYPGNIRELRNIVERLVVLSDDGILKKRDLPVIKPKNEMNFEFSAGLKTLREIRQ
ncbi:MAG TPA: sigma-54-dependent Fis family transcriptional regulator, partial [Clostridiales bacterium]|nr:sigma-54-dependent Fis family transcriptional regulator [Clostridiales bacterium]